MIESEKALIGILIECPELYLEIIDRVDPEWLNSNPNSAPIRKIYETIIGLISERKPYDIVSLSDTLNLPTTYLQKFIGFGSVGQLDTYLAQIQVNGLRIQSRKAASELISLSESAETVEDIQAGVERSLEFIRKNNIGRSVSSHHIKNVAARYKERILVDKDKNPEDLYMRTGILDLDRYVGGLYRKNLNVIAGIPGSGKTAFYSGIRDKQLRLGKSCISFILEMDEDRLLERYLSTRCEMDIKDVVELKFFGNETKERLFFGVLDDISRGNWHLHGIEYRNFPKLKNQVYRVIQETGGVDLIDIDFIQMLYIPGTKDNRNNELGIIVKDLAEMAGDSRVNANISILAQLNRANEHTADKRPTLRTLRDSGEIEASIDNGIFIYRDELYHPDSEKKGICELLVLKNRNGPTGVVEVQWDGATMSFRNLAKDHNF
jgi:replicative DNA helicase